MTTRENCADILCIGAQRSMTSWLHRIMVLHPDVSAFPNCEPITSTAKEAHYWDWNHHRGESWYRVLLRPLRDDQQSLDFTPDYALLDADQIADCKRLNPRAKVIYLLRDPLARALSALRMHSLWAGAKAEDAPLALTHDLLNRIDHARAIDHSDYPVALEKWRVQYPDLHVLNIEDVWRDPRGSIGELLEFLGLSHGAMDAGSLAQRLEAKVWVTPKIRFDRDVVHFLHGATWRARERMADEHGVTFAEGAHILEDKT